MANIQIRRYVNGTGWIDLFPKTLGVNVMGGSNNATPLINSGGKINTTFIPDFILGQLVYGGVVNGAGQVELSTQGKSKLGTAADDITLAKTATTDSSTTFGYQECEGLYFIASANNSSFEGVDFNVGDWVIATSADWKKIDNTDAVTSVCGKVGAVSLGTSDITGLSDALSGKVDKVSGKVLSTNDFTDALCGKLIGIEAGATKVTVDGALSSTSTNPVQNQVINTALNTKVDKVNGKGLSTNDFTNDYKNKLDGIAANANNYTHPTELSNAASSGLYKITVNTKGHITAVVAVAKSDITALGIPSENTTYSDATTSAHGLMTAANVITLNNLRAVGSSNPATATDGDIAFVTVS